MTDQEQEKINQNYAAAENLLSGMFADKTLSYVDIDTVAFLMKLVRSRGASVCKGAVAHSGVSKKRWSKEDTAAVNAWVGDNLPDASVRITPELIEAARAALTTKRSIGSVSSKLYEVRAQNAQAHKGAGNEAA